jgi:hypothetical protein
MLKLTNTVVAVATCLFNLESISPFIEGGAVHAVSVNEIKMNRSVDTANPVR